MPQECRGPVFCLFLGKQSTQQTGTTSPSTRQGRAGAQCRYASSSKSWWGSAASAKWGLGMGECVQPGFINDLNQPRFGIGLCRYPWTAACMELLLIVIGAWLYWRTARAITLEDDKARPARSAGEPLDPDRRDRRAWPRRIRNWRLTSGPFGLLGGWQKRWSARQK